MHRAPLRGHQALTGPSSVGAYGVLLVVEEWLGMVADFLSKRLLYQICVVT
jgi:hypothetical protein